jgi:hypothetical protein
MNLATKKNLLPALIFICTTIIAASCKTPRYIYSPSAHNVPVLTQKGDSKFGAMYSTNLTGEESRDGQAIDNRSRGIDAHGAVAITDNWAIQASHFYRWEKSTGGPDSLTLKYQRNLTEIGVGYFIPVNEKKNIFFQIFVGGGIGKFSFSDKDKIAYNFHEANITKIYLQPAMIFRSKGSFTNAVSVRGSIINYRNIKTSYSASQLQDYNLDNLTNRSKFFIEPAYTGSFGFKNVPGLRFEFQAGLSFLAARSYVDYRVINFSAGTWIDLGKMFNKKAE